MREIILASQSPRRLYLLKAMGLEFTVQPSNYDEKLDQNRPMSEVAMELALGKALDVAREHPDAVVIGSDTIVGVDGRQLEKPVDADEARYMLKSYMDKRSEVTTGLAVVCLSESLQIVSHDTAYVYFKSDSPEVDKLREAYIASENWRDKAGGYGFQLVRNTLIDHTEGSEDTIIGLPTKLLAEQLTSLGIPTHPVVVDPQELYGT